MPREKQNFLFRTFVKKIGNTIGVFSFFFFVEHGFSQGGTYFPFHSMTRLFYPDIPYMQLFKVVLCPIIILYFLI